MYTNVCPCVIQLILLVDDLYWIVNWVRKSALVNKNVHANIGNLNKYFNKVINLANDTMVLQLTLCYIVLCIYVVRRTLYDAYCMAYSVRRTLYDVHCITNILQRIFDGYNIF